MGENILEDQVEIDNPSDLSQNEARVLHSLIKWPDLTDQGIHSQIHMKKSTFSSIKARLKENDYFQKIYVPNFPLIGFEVMEIMHGHLNRFTSLSERMRVAGDVIKSFVEDFYVVSESNKAFNLSISENLTEYFKNQERFYKIYSENKFLTREGMKSQLYPFRISRVRSFLDFDSLIAKMFGFASEVTSYNLEMPTGNFEVVKLSKAEKKVLLGLIKYPEESDTLIADEVGVSRNTVANAKKRFLDENICFPKVIPNLSKLGLKLLVLSYRKFNPKTTMEQRKEASDLVRKHLSPFFYVSKNLDGFIISAHTSYEEYNRSMDEVVRYYLQHDYIEDEPITYNISIPDMTVIKNIEFLPLLEKYLEFSLSNK